MTDNDDEFEDALEDQTEALNYIGKYLDENEKLITPDCVVVLVQLLSFHLSNLKIEYPDVFDYCIKNLTRNIKKDIAFIEKQTKERLSGEVFH